MYKCTFDGNWAGSFGGALYADLVGLHVDKAEFIDNYAEAFGGAVYASLHSADLIMRDTLFEGNHAWGGAGGGMYLTRTHAFLKRVKFRSNGGTEGGGLFVGNEGAGSEWSGSNAGVL